MKVLATAHRFHKTVDGAIFLYFIFSLRNRKWTTPVALSR